MMLRMNLIAELVPPQGTFSDKDADARLDAFRTALTGGDNATLGEDLKTCAARIDQARQKIGSGTEIYRVSELMTLGQFGGASIGAALARICDDAAAESRVEALLVARFLVEIVFAAPHAPSLLPGDLLKQHRLDRKSVSWPEVLPVYRDLLARASEAINRADALGTRIASPALRKMLLRHRIETLRQIARLQDRDPASSGARLTGIDKVMISLRLFLRLRGRS